MAVAFTQSAIPKAVDRVIRCARSRRYLAGNAWTEDRKKATIFPDEMAAVRACVDQKLTHVELVLCDPVTHTELFSTWIR